MNRTLKISIIALSLLTALVAGEFFNFIYWFAGDLVRHGRPQAKLTTLLINNHQTITYCFLFPWLAFVALVGLRRQDSPRGDPGHFLLSFAFFAAAEAFVTAVCLLGLESPIYSINKALRGYEDTTFSLVVGFGFWATSATIVTLGGFRLFRKKLSDGKK